MNAGPGSRLAQAAKARAIRWSAHRHGADRLPLAVGRRRIYILPTRFGMALSVLLVAMLLGGLNYNSNLGLALGFLLTSLALVAMHHCHRNLLELEVSMDGTADAFAGGRGRHEFVLRNPAAVERRDIEIHCGGAAAITSIPAGGYRRTAVELPAAGRGVVRLDRFELRTRYPFGWFRAWTYVHTPLFLFVAPRPGGTRPLPALGALGTAAHGELAGDDEFAGLRAYEAGVPLKHMAWKVLARGGEPAVRSYTAPAAAPEWLEWTMLAGLDAEARLSQLCRWVLDCEARGGAYGLRLPEVQIPAAQGPEHRTACLRALAAHGAPVPGAATAAAPAPLDP